MANFSSRNILICVVPAVVILLSMFWFKKKKKKLDGSSFNQNAVCAPKSNAFDVQANIYSSIESTSDFSNTLSDASSISSPENSIRNENICETSSDDAANDSDTKEILSLSNHVHHLNYKEISFSKEQSVANCNSQIHNSKSGKMNAVTPLISDKLILTDCDSVTESIKDSLLLNLPENKNNLLHNSEGTLDNKQIINTANHDPEIGCSLLSMNSVFEHNGQKNSITENYSIENNLEESVISKIQNTFLTHSLNDQNEIDIVSETNKLNEADSHSSVLDENSLSSMSDESERQTDQQYKDSPSSVFDGNSISDESEKVDISNVQVATQPEENSNVLDSSSDVIQPSSISNGQYSVQLKKNSILAKTILSETIATEISSSSFDVVGAHSPAILQDSDYFISDNLQSSSEPCLASQADASIVEHNNQYTLLTDIDSSKDTWNISLASVDEPISSTSEDIVSSTLLQSCNREIGQSETATSQLSCDTTVSSSTAVVTSGKDVCKNSEQLDSITLVQTNSSVTDSIKAQDNQLESLSQTKVSGTDVVDVKSAGMVPGLFVYEFDLPQELCGRLIGKQGKHVKSIKERTNANVFIKRHPFDSNLKTVVVEGSRTAVHEALDIIRRKFPPSQFPTVTLIQTNMMSSHGVSLPESLQLHLPEGASCDVILSSLLSAGHFFLQQPTHPTYPSLSTLDQCMINCYSPMDTPSLPHPVEAGVICAAPVMNGWYRAQVIYVYENRSECEVKFVDYGGFQQVLTACLRQIRSDFMTLPFQASECYLANVRPVDCNAGWSAEATSVFEELAQGQILQALLIEYADDGIPCVHLYRVQGVSNMFINRELVERGLAVWVDNCHWDPH